MKKTAILIYLASGVSAAAHSGHDPALPADSMAHWLFAPVHGLGVIALAGAVLLTLHLRNKGAGNE